MADISQNEIAQALIALGCPQEKSEEMAMMLDKRSKQLMIERGQSYEEALSYLISLMRQGWAAKERGL